MFWKGASSYWAREERGEEQGGLAGAASRWEMPEAGARAGTGWGQGRLPEAVFESQSLEWAASGAEEIWR